MTGGWTLPSRAERIALTLSTATAGRPDMTKHQIDPDTGSAPGSSGDEACDLSGRHDLRARGSPGRSMKERSAGKSYHENPAWDEGFSWSGSRSSGSFTGERDEPAIVAGMPKLMDGEPVGEVVASEAQTAAPNAQCALASAPRHTGDPSVRRAARRARPWHRAGRRCPILR